MPNYPNDSDGQVLQLLASSGFDMDSVVPIEFAIDVPCENSAKAVVLALSKLGYVSEIDFDEGELGAGEKMTEHNKEFWPSWSVYVVVKMKPEYNSVVEMQNTLDEICRPYNAKSDGWGVLV